MLWVAVMNDDAAERWEIDQDAVGNPLVRHRHPPLAVQSHVTKQADGRRTARCPTCGDTFDVPARSTQAD
jgi:hypothetical protein